MRIRTRRTLVGEYGALAKRQVKELPEDLARRLIKRGSVESYPLDDAGTGEPADAGPAPEAVSETPTPPEPPHPLDHDGDGRPGGSLPASERDVCDELRDEYETLTGSAADRRWGEARLRREIEKAKGG